MFGAAERVMFFPQFVTARKLKICRNGKGKEWNLYPFVFFRGLIISMLPSYHLHLLNMHSFIRILDQDGTTKDGYQDKVILDTFEMRIY